MRVSRDAYHAARARRSFVAGAPPSDGKKHIPDGSGGQVPAVAAYPSADQIISR
jgi:hypothetical protein